MSKLDRSFIQLYGGTIRATSTCEPTGTVEVCLPCHDVPKTEHPGTLKPDVAGPETLCCGYDESCSVSVDATIPVEGVCSFTVSSPTALLEPSPTSDSPSDSPTTEATAATHFDSLSESCEMPTVPLEPSIDPAFQPTYEVDRFAWPETCQQLRSRLREDLRDVVDRMVGATHGTGKVMVVAGLHSGVGGTTLTLCLAAEIAARDQSVLVIDANLARPSLASSLGVAATDGWDSVGNELRSVDQALIASLEDGVAILPVVDAQAARDLLADHDAWPSMLANLRPHYDVILIDSEPLDGDLNSHSLLRHPSHGIDEAVLIEDTTTDRAASVGQHLRARHVVPIGVVINEHTVPDRKPESSSPSEDDAAFCTLSQPTV